PKRRLVVCSRFDQLYRIVWAGRHAGTAAGTRLGDQQRGVSIPMDGVGRASLDTFSANATLAAGIGDVEPVEQHAIQVDARLSMAGRAGILTDRAAFLAELR